MTTKDSLQPTEKSTSISNSSNKYKGESKMNTNKKTARIIEDVMIKLSALWVARMLAGFLGDVLRFFEPGILEQIIAGDVDGMQMTQELLLGGAIIMVLPIFMSFLSLTLKYKANRWANMGIGIFFVGFDLNFLISLFPMASSPAYEIFLGIVYLVFPALIVWYAWKWPKQEA